jgi:7-keto-8-aminopelargonate synthetase-like enzyme
VSDRANHASIVDGIRLSGARHLRYRHCDLDHLEAQLAAARRAGARRLLVVTDTVFSMDGDVAPLAEIVALKERYGAALLVDDAHGAGVLGPGGAGTVPALGLTGRVDLELGTFSKAFGGYGAFVAGAAAWIDRLVNACRTLIYSTGLPPAVVGAVDRAIDLVRDADDLRGTLQRHAERTRAALAAAALDTAGSTTQIVPVVVGANDAAVRLASGLERRGVLAVAIRPPTVPHGRARVRLSLTAALGDDDLEQALAAVVAEAGGGS